MRENPPIMVLADETADSVTFRFKGRSWAIAMLAIGIALLAAVASVSFRATPPNTIAAGIAGLLGVLSLYSSAYSWTATQWLTAGGDARSVRFHKKNFYGCVEWRKPASDFEAVRVWKYRKSSNWSITLVDRDGYGLHLGENFLGALSHDRAYAIAWKVSSRTGIPIEDAQAPAAAD